MTFDVGIPCDDRRRCTALTQRETHSRVAAAISCPVPSIGAILSSSAFITVAIGRFGDIFDRGLTEILAGDPRFDVLGASLARPDLTQFVIRHAPRIVIVDGHTELRYLHKITSLPPAPNIIVLARAPRKQQALQRRTRGDRKPSICDVGRSL
jgi:hypothetical protein